MHARWRTRAATFCALVCSVFLVGNVDAGEYSSDLGSIILRLQDILQDVDDMRADYAQDYPELYLQIESIASQANALLSSLDSAKDSTTGGFNVVLAASQLSILTSSLQKLDRDMLALGVGSVTNFLGYSDFQDATTAFWQVFSQTYGEIGENGYGAIYVIPIQSNMEAEIADFLSATPGDNDPQQGVGRSSWQTAMHAYAIRQWLEALDLSSLSPAATTNLLTTQNSILERVAEYVAGVSNAVGTISNEYETDPTGSNALPAEKKPADLEVEKSVDTSSLEEAVQQTFDGLDSLTPTGSSTVPEIMIRDAYRGEDAIKVRLDLSEIGIATRICKACWAILLAVGVLGVVRSEWDYWTTLGGSAT